MKCDFYLIFFFINFTHVFSQKFKNVITWNNNQREINYSYYFTEENLYHENRKTFNLTKKVIENKYTNFNHGNVLNITLTNNNNIHDVVEYELNKIIRDGNEIKFKNNLNNSSIPIKINIIKPEIQLKINSLNKSFNISNAISIDNLIIGIDSKFIKIYSYTNNKFIEEYTDEIFKTENEIKISENKIKYILKDENKLLIEDEKFNLYLFVYTKGNLFQMIEVRNLKNEFDENISNFIYNPRKSNKLILSYKNKGIKIVNLNDTKKSLSINSYQNKVGNKIEKLGEISDMQEIGNEIIIIIKNKGIKTLNIEQIDDNLVNFSEYIFIHPNLIKFNKIHSDSFSKHENNYTTQGSLLGIIVDNNFRNEGDEFYFEMIIQNSKKSIYKIYIDENKYQLSNLFDTELHTFLFDEISKSIIILSKSSINNPIYKIRLEELQNKKINEIILFQNENNSKFLGFVTDDNFIYFNIENDILTAHKINIEFKEPGRYEIIFNTYVEKCHENSDYIIYRNCEKEIIYKFHMKNGSHNETVNEFYIMALVLWLLFAVLILVKWISQCNCKSNSKVGNFNEEYSNAEQNV